MCPSAKSTVVPKESGADSKVKREPTQVSSGSSLTDSINRKNKTNTHLLFFPKQYVVDRNQKKCVARMQANTRLS